MLDKPPYLFGVDLGGSKIELAVLDQDKRVFFRERVPTEQHLGFEHILSKITLLFNRAVAAVNYKPAKMGIGIPGCLENGLVKNANTQCLNGQAFEALIAEQLEIHICVENDANCFVKAETILGELDKENNSILGLIIGTGVGSGLFINGNVVSGKHGIAGEWGHNAMPIQADTVQKKCYCGKMGCIETILSGPALSQYHYEKTGNQLPVELINYQAQQGNKSCQSTLQYWYRHFLAALSQVINIIDPDIILVGGGLGNLDCIYDSVKQDLNRYIFTQEFTGKIIPPKLGDSAGVFGAALL